VITGSLAHHAGFFCLPPKSVEEEFERSYGRMILTLRCSCRMHSLPPRATENGHGPAADAVVFGREQQRCDYWLVCTSI
jgi:hypothetical protein